MITLEERRKEACRKFAEKLAASERFGGYFKLNTIDPNAPALRNTKTYVEEYARSERLPGVTTDFTSFEKRL